MVDVRVGYHTEGTVRRIGRTSNFCPSKPCLRPFLDGRRPGTILKGSSRVPDTHMNLVTKGLWTSHSSCSQTILSKEPGW